MTTPPSIRPIAIRAPSRVAAAVLTFGGVGRLPRGPATAGTLAGAAVMAVLRPGRRARLALALAAGVAGQGLVARALGPEDPDPQHVVIDEVAGVWLALASVPGPVSPARAGAGAVLFRALDKFKPGPVGWVDRHGGRWSLMGDDLLAGALAGLALRLLVLADDRDG